MKVSIDYLFQRCPLWPQWLTAVEIGLVSLSIGIMNGWTSPYMARLTKADSELPINESEASWVASFINIGRMSGAAVGGVAQIFMSSKNALLFSGIPTAVGWLCLLVAESVIYLYIARFSSGIGMGIFFASYPLFIAEISSPKIRGSLIGLIMICMPIGNLVGNLMGMYVSLWLFATISLVPNLIYLGFFPLLPASPHHLTRLKQYEKAEKSLRWYQPDIINYKSEIESLSEFVKVKESQTMMDVCRELNEPKNRRALFIVDALYFFMQMSGLYSIYFYMEIILANAKVTMIKPATLVYVVAGVGIISGWLALRAIDKYGRKILLTISSAGVALGMALYGCHYALLRLNYYDPETLQWFSIMGSLAFQIFVCIGITPIPSVMLGELFPPNVKSLAACITSVLSGLFSFIASKTYQPLTDIMHEEYVFAIYAVIMMIQVVFCVYYIPETKGKSLQEIQEMLSKKKSPRR